MKKVAIHQKKRAGAPAWYNKWFQSPMWLMGFCIALAVCFTLYAANAVWGTLSPGSAWGIGYGITATVLFVGTMLYALRRKAIRIKGVHRAWFYLQFHVYGGTLFIVFMLMHINFQMPQGALATWLWALSLWIVISGLVGSAFQKWIPTLLNSGLSTEVNFQRIPELIADAQKKAAKIAGNAGLDVQDLYDQQIKHNLEGPRFRWLYFFDLAGAIQRELATIKHVEKFLDDTQRQHLTQLEMVYKTKLEMDAHYTLQKVLRTWLMLHIPVSMVILVLLAIHIFVALYY